MKRLYIDHRPDAIYTALTENGKLTELFIDTVTDNTKSSGSWVGRIIVGRLKTILPGQFAFIDIGGKKNAFINLHKGHGLKAGQPVLVQVEKDAVGTKGMCVGLEISLKGRLIVLYAQRKEQAQGVGISRKITNEKEARRLRKIVWKLLPAGYGAIVRTNAEGQPKPAIAEEIEHLHKTLVDIITRAEYILPPATLYPVLQESIISQDLLSDLLSEDIEEIQISTNTAETFAEIKNAIHELLPILTARTHKTDAPCLSAITSQIKAALQKEVRLSCGGYITIEQTEACVVIDVNTGSNVGNTDYRTTILETNLDAAVVIAAQIRLRNLSGIIIIDFIDMPKEADKTALLTTLEAEIKKDRIKTEIAGFIGLGMVQLTRRKSRPPISHFLTSKCPHCGGQLEELQNRTEVFC
ncbi:MAG: ribonuclease E/G [Defluviitaleaceae bacterium]|nr:ribonuclease E/G [Defluviitaleaceae bacterium]